MAFRGGSRIFINCKQKSFIFSTREISSLNSFLNTKACQERFNESKILKVAVIGSPNAGKSTVINKIVGREVLAISKKVHTTESCCRAVYNKGSQQIIFLDTPGLISLQELQKYKLKETYFKGGEDAVVEADLIGVIHDVSNTFTRSKLDPKILRLLHLYKHKDSFLVLNKIDTVKSKRQLLEILNHLTQGKLKKSYNDVCNSLSERSLSEIEAQQLINKQPQWEHFSAMFMVSALLGNGIDDVKDYLLEKTYPGDWIFPHDKYTDKNPVDIIEETVRSKLLDHLPQEVPYKLDIRLEYLDMDNEDCITAVVLICCYSDRIQGFIKGIRGERIKMIAIESEQAMADAFLSDVHLKLVLMKKEKEMSQ